MTDNVLTCNKTFGFGFALPIAIWLFIFIICGMGLRVPWLAKFCNALIGSGTFCSKSVKIIKIIWELSQANASSSGTYAWWRLLLDMLLDIRRVILLFETIAFQYQQDYDCEHQNVALPRLCKKLKKIRLYYAALIYITMKTSLRVYSYSGSTYIFSTTDCRWAGEFQSKPCLSILSYFVPVKLTGKLKKYWSSNRQNTIFVIMFTSLV